MSITGSEQWMYRATGSFYPHTIDGALFIDGLSTASLSRAAVAVDDTTKATWSFWWKRASGLYTNFSSEGEFFLQNTSGTNRGFRLRTNSLGEGTLSLFVNPTSGTSAQLVTDREFRDQAGWVHVIWHWDSANAVESERVRLYVNGTRVTEFSTETYPPLNDAHDFNTGFGGWRVGSTSSYQGTSAGKRAFRGYLTEFHFMDGYNYGPEYFGETKSGVWVPIEVTGVTYGTGGWYLPMTSNGNDASGNGNHFTENNVGAHDYKTDSPTNNFCVLDANNSYNFRLSEGNLKFANTTTRWDGALATFAVPKTGKWYWEVYINAGTNVVTGLANGSSNLINDTGYDEYENYSYGINQTSVRYGTTVISTESPPTSSSGDVLGWYVDDGDVYLYKNGTQIASPTSWTSNMDAVDYDYFPQIFAYGSGTGATFNFGQDGTFAGATTAGGNADSEGIGDFKYTVPTGAKALCTSNLPAPASADPSKGEEGTDYFGTLLYSGDGNSTKTIQSGGSGVTGDIDFTPDFVWIKNRDQADKHHLYDSVRGVQKALYSNTTTAETDELNGLLNFNTNGFTIGNEVEVNTSGEDYVAWCWKAGGTAVSNSNGTITSSVSANTDSGFSIVKYTGNNSSGSATVGHGLGAAPEFIIVKLLDNNSSTWDNWVVGCDPLGWGDTSTLYLNTTAAKFDGHQTTPWNNTAPTSSVFSVASSAGAGINYLGADYIAYCFHSVDGFSKFGSFEGNEEAGQSDGAFVYTGFAPAFVMIKNIDSAANWIILDNKRPNTSGSAFNPKDTSSGLHPNLTNAESTDTTYRGDFLSNGFSVASGSTAWNNGNNTFIFMAFGETPFKYANAR